MIRAGLRRFLAPGAMMKDALMLLFVLPLATFGPVAFAQERDADAFAHWARVLKDFVNDQGQVDFHGLASKPADLNAFVDYIAGVSPESAPSLFPTKESGLAYHINAYNALSMYNVIDSGIPKSLAGLTKLWFFGFKKFSIGSERLTLRSYENDVIRPAGDERVHFALNCMSVGCPHLPREPFTAAGLDNQLDREARQFFAEPRNLRVFPERKTVRVSEILKFYKEDFLRDSPNLIAYVNRYAAEKIPENYQVEFFEYDWTINDQTGARTRDP